MSFFSRCGGLDLGFVLTWFDVVWANEYDKSIWGACAKNHRQTFLDERDIRTIDANEIPDCDGILGGPPCQSWNEAGIPKGIQDTRGKLFYDFIRLLRAKQPRSFLAENVGGMLMRIHATALTHIKNLFRDGGYTLSSGLLNAPDYEVSPDRKHVFFVGIRNNRAAHKTVKHSVKEYVDGEAHTNGIGSFWALLKRGYYGAYHRMSPKHLQRYDR